MAYWSVCSSRAWRPSSSACLSSLSGAGAASKQVQRMMFVSWRVIIVGLGLVALVVGVLVMIFWRKPDE